MRLWAHRYVLRARASLSGIAKSPEREGALIKVETSSGVGYADVHPWTELGDAPLAKQLTLLTDGRATALGARSLELAALDADARGRGVSAFEGLAQPPPSHRLISIADLSTARLEEAAASGFRTLKLKIGAEPEREARALRDLADALARFRLRLDANGQFSAPGFLDFIGGLPAQVSTAIEFVEDPIDLAGPGGDGLAVGEAGQAQTGAAGVRAWAALSAASPVPLAIDRLSGAPDAALPAALHAKWIILKPAVQRPAIIANWARAQGAAVAVTSYLDHPVGQVGAALEAARLVSMRDAALTIGASGLCSHTSYEPNDFSEALGGAGPEFPRPAGVGIGFGELLQRLEWRELK